MLKQYFAVLFFFMLPSYLLAQNALEDQAYLKVVEAFKMPDNVNPKLVNGPVYQNEYVGYVINQFMFQQKLVNGNITVDGETFKNVSLNYDLQKDLLILGQFNNNVFYPVILHNSRVDSFSAEGHLFVHVKHLPIVNNKKRFKGYYEVVHQGTISFVIKHVKKVDKSQDITDLRFVSFNKRYLLKEGKIYRFWSNLVLNWIADSNKKELKQLVREANYQANASPDKVLKTILEKYELSLLE